MYGHFILCVYVLFSVSLFMFSFLERRVRPNQFVVIEAKIARAALYIHGDGWMD